MIIDCISDLHGERPTHLLKGGDLLIIAGDLTLTDKEKEYDDFCKWILCLPYEYVVVIAGNHDNFLQDNPDYLPNPGGNFCYLCDSGCEFEIEEEIQEDHKFRGAITYKQKRKIKIWGSPWTTTFEGINPHCCAFTVDTDEELDKKWELIPEDTDILITHCPPNGILDFARIAKDHVGSRSLRNHVIGRIKPRIQVYGHIHEWGGNLVDLVTTRFINASHVNEDYEPVNAPIRIVL